MALHDPKRRGFYWRMTSVTTAVVPVFNAG